VQIGANRLPFGPPLPATEPGHQDQAGPVVGGLDISEISEKSVRTSGSDVVISYPTPFPTVMLTNRSGYNHLWTCHFYEV
jgi:hypothetical protein